MFILLYSMFVSVVLDPGGIECATLTEKNLNTLKKDIDRVTDYYDVVRMYQYPIDGMMAITTLNQKKWQRIMLRPPKEKK